MARTKPDRVRRPAKRRLTTKLRKQSKKAEGGAQIEGSGYRIRLDGYFSWTCPNDIITLRLLCSVSGPEANVTVKRGDVVRPKAGTKILSVVRSYEVGGLREACSRGVMPRILTAFFQIATDEKQQM